jgi:hypothetical protein
MARTQKIDNALQKRFSYTNNKKRKDREVRIYFLIVCEGAKTEPNYFKSFPKQIGKVVYDIELEGGGLNTLRVVEKAIELRDKSAQKYDRVWAVFDKDSFPARDFNNAILKAKANHISCAWSNEAFELWYLLHFHNRVTPMSRDKYKESIERAVNDQIKDKKKAFSYAKNAPDMYRILENYGDQSQAIRWAKELTRKFNDERFALHNPCTHVFQLVEELIGKSDTLNQEITEKLQTGD